MKLEREVNECLQQMATSAKEGDIKAKGTFGELALLKVCEEIYQEKGGILYHSYTYKTEPDLPGNIKKEDGKLYLENLGNVTEIDVLLVTPYKVYPIEVKSYKAKKITFTDDGIAGCQITNKSPIHQNEMHCRHLYPKLLRVLPEGRSKYIEPVVVLVDKCQVEDNRSDIQKAYIKLATLNNFRSCIMQLDTPYEYRLDLDAVYNCLEEACCSAGRKFVLRKVGA